MRRFGQDLVAWRSPDGEVRLLGDRCPHRGTKLSLGTVRDDCVECPFHGFLFDATGACTLIPANGPEKPVPQRMRVPRYPTHEAHGLVMAWMHDSEPGPRPGFFPELEGLGWGSFQTQWNTHWTRVVGNQLDYAHLSFVHRTTIGRGFPSQIHVGSDIEDDRIRVWAEVDGERTPSFVEWRAPNLWINRMSDTSYGFLVFIPVDDDRTALIVRTYLRRRPWVDPLVHWVMKQANRWILSQDQAVVEAQHPLEARLAGGETLIQADAPITAFRRIREGWSRSG